VETGNGSGVAEVQEGTVENVEENRTLAIVKKSGIDNWSRDRKKELADYLNQQGF
jgi:hypothetical protein